MERAGRGRTVAANGRRDAESLHCLVTGASGYVGTRLVPKLLESGHRVRCLVRSPAKLSDQPWAADAESVQGDVSDPRSVTGAIRGVDVAKVGRIFLDSEVPGTVLRAAVVIDSALASFQMPRYLTERLAVMVTLSRVHTCTHPIWARDVLRHLVGSATMPDESLPFDEASGPGPAKGTSSPGGHALVVRLRPRHPQRTPLDASRLGRRQSLPGRSGLLGHASLWSVSPFHAVVFGGMAGNITQAAAKGLAAHAGDQRSRRIRRRRPRRSTEHGARSTRHRSRTTASGVRP